jgi:hypothetical protein
MWEWETFFKLQSQLRSHGESILVSFEELKARQGENKARLILDQRMADYKTQSNTMMNELATTIERVLTELTQQLGPVPQQHWMVPNPNSMIDSGGSEYAGSAVNAFAATLHKLTGSLVPDTYIPMPQPIDSSPPAMGPQSILGTDPEANGDAFFAAHPQTSSLPPGAPGIGGQVSGLLVTLEWRTDRQYHTRVRVVEATSEGCARSFVGLLSTED